MSIRPSPPDSDSSDSSVKNCVSAIVFPDADSAQTAYELLSTLRADREFAPILKGMSRPLLLPFAIEELEALEQAESPEAADMRGNITPPVDLEMADASAWESCEESDETETAEVPEDYAVPV